ncbi:MAG: hypothetical protein ACYDC5_07560 [Candidatus Dormibacteria bacterium]
MVYRTYQIRQVEESDLAKWEGWAQAEEERGEVQAAQGTRDFLRQWDADQGQEKEELACPICGSRWLTPTARGTSRPHTRWDVSQPSWDRVRQLRKDIQALQAELDRELDLLEGECPWQPSG